MDKHLEKALVDGMDYKTYRAKIQRLFEADQTTNNDNKEEEKTQAAQIREVKTMQMKETRKPGHNKTCNFC